MTVVDDSYNSSPTSAIAAVRSLVRLPVDGQRIAVLGEMLELGSHSEAGYTEVGRAVGEGGVDVLIAVGRDLGPLAEVVRRTRTVVHEVADADEAIMLVLRAARPGDAVLVKASRAVGLERVAEALVERESVT